MTDIRIGILGGSGLYQMDDLADVRELAIPTPYGDPSDRLVAGRLDGVEVVFLSRHGRGHRLLPGEVPYRANLHALKQLGVQYLVSVSAVGSLQEQVAPLDVVLPDQYIDLTRRREGTFFGDGAVAHVSLADPVCGVLRGVLAAACAEAAGVDVVCHDGGTYVCIEGPAFSTRAESRGYRAQGATVIGMTNMPEARLAREAEMAYASLCLVTDWDCWHPHQACVDAATAIRHLQANAARAQRIVRQAVRRIADGWPASPAHTALDAALVTPVAAMPTGTRERLAPLLRRMG